MNLPVTFVQDERGFLRSRDIPLNQWPTGPGTGKPSGAQRPASKQSARAGFAAARATRVVAALPYFASSSIQIARAGSPSPKRTHSTDSQRGYVLGGGIGGGGGIYFPVFVFSWPLKTGMVGVVEHAETVSATTIMPASN